MLAPLHSLISYRGPLLISRETRTGIHQSLQYGLNAETPIFPDHPESEASYEILADTGILLGLAQPIYHFILHFTKPLVLTMNLTLVQLTCMHGQAYSCGAKRLEHKRMSVPRVHSCLPMGRRPGWIVGTP